MLYISLVVFIVFAVVFIVSSVLVGAHLTQMYEKDFCRSPLFSTDFASDLACKALRVDRSRRAPHNQSKDTGASVAPRSKEKKIWRESQAASSEGYRITAGSSQLVASDNAAAYCG